MDLMEDEPRKHPKPVPFCQNSILKPIVPEISLILQDDFDDQTEPKKSSFSGTEFQTYNAWKWKYKNLDDKAGNVETRSKNKCLNSPNLQECCLIKDKYSSSDIERRKNEILYGQSDEPRRPLPPWTNPVIPKTGEAFFSNTSFDDLSMVDNDIGDRFQKEKSSVSNQEKNITSNCDKSQEFSKKLDNSKNLYNIISEQNKQMEILQKQIEQLLKLQDVKDKQIEQLLKSQESKEKKIEQLLLSLGTKDKEVEQLLRLKEKQEHQVQELLRSHEVKQQENLDLLNKLSKVQRKDVHSVGIMTNLQMVDASVNTSLEYCVKECCNRKDENTVQEDISCLRDLNDSNRFNVKDKSLFSLHSADLPPVQEHVPTPQSSIHVDIQDYHDSSDESGDESGTISQNFPTALETQTNPLGYTFYNNVLTQVKDIIHNSGEKESKRNADRKTEINQHAKSKPLTECNYVREERGTVQSFQAWGILERENIPPSNDDYGKSNYAERLMYETPNLCLKDTNSPSDISLKINALALKYLKHEQISRYDIQPQISTPRQPDVTIYNVTNLSFGSMRYLDRYEILPKVKDKQVPEINAQHNDCSPAQLLQRKKKMNVQENFSSAIGNVLDMSTLNQQPKLL